MNAETKNLQNKLEKIQQRIDILNSSKEIKLNDYPPDKRIAPNAFLRSALFSAIQSKDRVFLDGVVLASQQGITVRFTGKQLNQEDLTLWETLVHLAKDQPLGNVCEFTAYDILKTMGVKDGGAEREVLHKSIIRLTACAVEILINENRVYFSSLIESGAKDEKTSKYTIQLSKSLIKLYENQTWLDWQQRAKLKRKPLAQFLHGYYSSHKNPHPVKIETLQNLAGSKNKRLSDFKQKVSDALNELVKIEFLESYVIDDEIVTVNRKK